MNFDTYKYKEWLRSNTKLSENSISLYGRTAQAYFKEHSELTLENINFYVTKSFREKSSLYVKYSFKPLLEFMGFELDTDGIPTMYKRVVAVKQKPRKKHGKYLPAKMIRQIIEEISNEELRDIAELQYATGARAFEIIELREENIDWEFNPEIIRIYLGTKGGREGVTFLDRLTYGSILEKYCSGKPGFLFLPDTLAYDEEELKRAVNTKRSYLYEEIKKVTKKLGIERLGTHDLRRNVSEELRKSGADLRTIQKALNHTNINTTMKYFSDNREDVSKAVVRHQGGEDVQDRKNDG